MSSDGVNSGRRKFLTAATSAVGVAGAVGIAVPFVGSWNPSAKAKAAGAPVKADISKLEPGQMVVVEWRGKPVYVMHRTQSQIDDLPKLIEGQVWVKGYFPQVFIRVGDIAAIAAPENILGFLDDFYAFTS